MLTQSYLLRYKLQQLLLMVALISAANHSLAQPHQSSTTHKPALNFATFNIGHNEMHYAYSGGDNLPGLLFVHGTPGGWGAFDVYLQNQRLQQQFFMVSVDRLGWGKSTITAGHIEASFERQADSIVAVMSRYPTKKWIIIGHSLGASIAPQIAMQAPERISGLLLLAGTLDPKLGRPRWYNWAASTWLVSKMIGKQMRNSNREIMQLRSELEKMNQQLKQRTLTANVLVMQGLKDNLVSPKNPAFAQQRWTNSFASIEVIELAEAGHFLPWRQTSRVIKAIQQLAQKQ